MLNYETEIIHYNADNFFYINNISWNFGYTQIGDKPFDGEMLYGHHENYGKIGDYSIHSSKTVIGENNEYIFAMIFRVITT